MDGVFRHYFTIFISTQNRQRPYNTVITNVSRQSLYDLQRNNAVAGISTTNRMANRRRQYRAPQRPYRLETLLHLSVQKQCSQDDITPGCHEYWQSKDLNTSNKLFDKKYLKGTRQKFSIFSTLIFENTSCKCNRVRSTASEPRVKPKNQRTFNVQTMLLIHSIHIKTCPTKAWLNAVTVETMGLLINKLAPCGTDGRLLTTDVSSKFKVTWQKN